MDIYQAADLYEAWLEATSQHDIALVNNGVRI